jgi:hypothetical protein
MTCRNACQRGSFDRGYSRASPAHSGLRTHPLHCDWSLPIPDARPASVLASRLARVDVQPLARGQAIGDAAAPSWRSPPARRARSEGARAATMARPARSPPPTATAPPHPADRAVQAEPPTVGQCDPGEHGCDPQRVLQAALVVPESLREVHAARVHITPMSAIAPSRVS